MSPERKLDVEPLRLFADVPVAVVCPDCGIRFTAFKGDEGDVQYKHDSGMGCEHEGRVFRGHQIELYEVI